MPNFLTRMFGFGEGRPIRREGPRLDAGKFRVRSYDAAKTTRLNVSQEADYSGPNAAIRTSLAVIRARARHMAGNNSHGKRFISLVSRQVIGPEGIKAKFQPLKGSGKPDKNAADLMALAWRQWCKPGNCEITGTKSFWMLCNEIMKAWARDGEVIIRKHWGKKRGPFGFQLELIEADRLDELYSTTGFDGGSRVIMGVELDNEGKRLAYHIFSQDLRDYGFMGSGALKRDRVPASQIIHLHIPERIGSVRGISWLKAVMGDLYQLREYRTSEEIAARESANKGGFLIPPTDGDERDLGDNEIPGEGEDCEDGDTAADTGDPESYEITLESQPGTYQITPPGWDFKQYDPNHPNAAFADFDRAILLTVAAGLDAAYASLTGDYSNFSYASGRLALLDERDVWMSLQRLFIDTFLENVGEEWLLAYLSAPTTSLSILDKDRLNNIRWIPRRWPWVDPKKDTEAHELQVKNRFRSRTEIVAEAGGNFEDVVRDQAAEEELMRAAGLSIPTDKKAGA